MSGLKDYTRVFIIALVTALGSQLLGRLFVANDKIHDSATLTQLEEANIELNKNIYTAKKDAFNYCDVKMIDHEKVHKEINTQYIQIQTDLNIIKDHLINKHD